MKRTTRLFALLAALSLLVCCVLPALALSAQPKYTYDGIDVSVFQGDIDFQRVRQSGIRVVYIRAGFAAGQPDPNFAKNARAARLAGLRYGFYFFVSARTPHEAELQGRYFASLIRRYDYDCRPVMDFEEYSGLSVAEIRSIGLSFIRALEQRSRVLPMLYSDAYAASSIWGEDFARYPLWVADYGPSEPDVESDVWSGWEGFQYSDSGRIPGIDADVDLDKFTERVFLTERERTQKDSCSG